MHINKLLEKTNSQIKHKTYLNMLDAFQYSYKKYGFDISHVISMSYSSHGNPLHDKGLQKKVEEFKSAMDYEMQQGVNNLSTMLTAIGNYRRSMQKNSLLKPDDYVKQFDVFSKAIRDTHLQASKWWGHYHQRTSSRIVCNKDTKAGIEQDEKDSWGFRKIHVPPLWFHKVWKKGLSGVEYKGRPHFVVDAKSVNIARLEQSDMKVYKADVITSKNGILSMIKDFWLVAFETDPMIIRDSGYIDPAKCIASISPELKLAEVNVSKRITKNVINNLLD